MHRRSHCFIFLLPIMTSCKDTLLLSSVYLFVSVSVTPSIWYPLSLFYWIFLLFVFVTLFQPLTSSYKNRIISFFFRKDLLSTKHFLFSSSPSTILLATDVIFKSIQTGCEPMTLRSWGNTVAFVCIYINFYIYLSSSQILLSFFVLISLSLSSL